MIRAVVLVSPQISYLFGELNHRIQKNKAKSSIKLQKTKPKNSLKSLRTRFLLAHSWAQVSSIRSSFAVWSVGFSVCLVRQRVGGCEDPTPAGVLCLALLCVLTLRFCLVAFAFGRDKVTTENP
jgi:hypothetical protein